MAFDRNWGLRELIGGFGQGLEMRENALEELQKQKQQEQGIQDLTNIYKQLNIPHAGLLARQRPDLQNIFVKDALRPKSLMEKVSNRFLGNKNVNVIKDDQGNALGLQVGNNAIPISEVTPEMVQELEATTGDSTIGQKIGQAVTGGVSSFLGAPSDILSLGAKGIGLLDKFKNKINLTATETLDRNLRQILGVQEEPQLLDQMRQSMNEQHPLESLAGYLPTSENISEKVIPAITEGTPLEKYTVPQNENDKWWQEMGGLATLAALPGNAYKDLGTKPLQTLGSFFSDPKNIGNAAKKLLKGLGIAVGADTAGWLTEDITGSKLLGDTVKAGSFLMGTLFPGMPRRLGTAKYNEFNTNVIQPALEQGKNVPAQDILPKLESLEQKVSSIFKSPSKAQKFIENEVNTLHSINSSMNGSNPEALWNNIKRMNETPMKKIPVQSRNFFKELKNIQVEALKNFSDKMIPGGGKLYSEANNLWATAKNIEDEVDFVKKNLNVRNIGLGTAIWFAGGFPIMIGAGAAEAGRRFMGHMLKSPSIRNAITQLAKASAAQNASAVNKIMKHLNTLTEKELGKLPKKDQDAIRQTLSKDHQLSASVPV